MSSCKIAVLDDYQDFAKSFVDWAPVLEYSEIEVFTTHLHEENEILTRLMPFDIICIMRERTPLTANLLMSLINLKLVISNGLILLVLIWICAYLTFCAVFRRYDSLFGEI